MNRAERRASGRNGAEPQPQMPTVIEQRTYPTFAFAVEDMGDIRTLHFFIPGGKQLSFPFGAENAVEAGQKMCAPSVETADLSDMPRGAVDLSKP